MTGKEGDDIGNIVGLPEVVFLNSSIPKPLVVLYTVGVLITAWIIWRLIRKKWSSIKHWIKAVIHDAAKLTVSFFAAIKPPALLKRLSGKGKQLDDTGYEDEKISLIKWRSLAGTYKEQLKKWLARLMEKEPQWKDLKDNRDRIRYLYRRLLVRSILGGYDYKDYLTPSETLDDLNEWNPERAAGSTDVVSLYNKARYGDLDVGDDAVEGLKVQMESDSSNRK